MFYFADTFVRKDGIVEALNDNVERVLEPKFAPLIPIVVSSAIFTPFPPLKSLPILLMKAEANKEKSN